MSDDELAATVAATVERLVERGVTLAVAESLTGGAVVEHLVRVPGVSRVLFGGVVAYRTELKRDLVGVDARLLEQYGAVHPKVAAQLAERVRVALAVNGVAARVGVGTTGVAGPDPQDGVKPGVAFVAVAVDDRTEVRELRVRGDRADVRQAAARAALMLLAELTAPEDGVTR